MKIWAGLATSGALVWLCASGCSAKSAGSAAQGGAGGLIPVGGASGSHAGSAGSDAGASGEVSSGAGGDATAAAGSAGETEAGGAGGAGGAGAAGGAGGAGAAGEAGESGCPAIAATGSGGADGAASCREKLTADSSLADGTYTLDLDGAGPLPALPFYCDMTGGGWTLIANQVPAALLPDTICTVNPAGFGSLSESYRLGNPAITSIQPSVAWKLTDPTNAVYFKPDCVVDWTINYNSLNPMPTACTTGYTSSAFTSVQNGGWQRVSARGIGINNYGEFCSIRMFESHSNTEGTIEPSSQVAGLALPCNYQQFTTQRVSLWFL